MFKLRLPVASNAGIQIGVGGTMLKRVIVGSVSVNPPSIAASTSANVDVSIAGLTTTMRVIVSPPADLEDDLEFRGVSVPSNGTLRLRLRNNSASAVDGAARTWHYVAFEA